MPSDSLDRLIYSLLQRAWTQPEIMRMLRDSASPAELRRRITLQDLRIMDETLVEEPAPRPIEGPATLAQYLDIIPQIAATLNRMQAHMSCLTATATATTTTTTTHKETE